MGLVRGEDVILSILESQEGVGDVYVPIGCARSVTFDISSDFIETSVTESGAFKTFIPSGKQYSGNIEGLVFLDKPKTSETRATQTYGYATWMTDEFPNDGSSGIITIDDPDFGVIELCNISGPFLTYEAFVDAIVADFNTNTYGYQAAKVVSGISILTVFTARPNLGSTINGLTLIFDYNWDGFVPSLPPQSYNPNPFSGGIDPYFPSKISSGFLYSKIISGEQFQIKYYESDDDNHFLYKVCQVYIESINETASFDNMVTFSAQFKGNGAPNIFYGEI